MEDGPAVIEKNDDQEWWLNGKYFVNKQPENWEELIKLDYRNDHGNLNDKFHHRI